MVVADVVGAHMVVTFDKPERICIVDHGGSIVRLNDAERTDCRFDACDRPRARRILDALNAYHSACRTVDSRGPYRLLPLIGE